MVLLFGCVEIAESADAGCSFPIVKALAKPEIIAFQSPRTNVVVELDVRRVTVFYSSGTGLCELRIVGLR